MRSRGPKDLQTLPLTDLVRDPEVRGVDAVTQGKSMTTRYVLCRLLWRGIAAQVLIIPDDMEAFTPKNDQKWSYSCAPFV